MSVARLTTLTFTLLVMAALRPLYAERDTAAWTMLVYFAADNNLEHYAILDFNELEAVGSSAQVNVVAQIDRSPDYDTSNGNWTDTRRYFVTHDNDTALISSTRLDGSSPLGELDMGNPQTLIDFVNWGIDNFPAQHYAIVVWNHGDGWYKRAPSQRDVLFKGIGIDESTPDSNCIGVANGEFAFALNAIKNHLGRKIDLLGFDACLMQMWEVQDIADDYASFMVGSEEAMYVEGWNYTQFLQSLTGNPTLSPAEVGAAVADACVDGSKQLTMSCVDLSRIGALNLAVNNFACQLRSASNVPGLRQIISDLRMQQALSSQIYLYFSHVDLYRTAELVNADSRLPLSLRTAASATMSAVTNAVIYNRQSVDPDYSWSHGIAIYYPHAIEFYDTTYQLLPTATTSNWGYFIGNLSGGPMRGDVNADGSVDISDVVYIIAYIFSGGPAPNPIVSGDCNCDDAVDISDAVYLIAYIFSGGPPPCGGC